MLCGYSGSLTHKRKIYAGHYFVFKVLLVEVFLCTCMLLQQHFKITETVLK